MGNADLGLLTFFRTVRVFRSRVSFELFFLYEPFSVEEAVTLGSRDFQAEQKTLLLAREKRLRITVEYFGDDTDPLDFHKEAFDIIKWDLIRHCAM